MFFHYLKFFLFHAVGLTAFAALVAGGEWISYGLFGILGFYIIGDAVLGDDTSEPKFQHPGILTFQLWLALPLVALIAFASVWSVSDVDLFGFGQWVTHITGYDVLASREATHLGNHIAGFFLTFLMIGVIGTITGHELTHRTWDPVSMAVGRWLLAFSFDTPFAIEHVYGHHRYVSTKEDPATAPRGRNVYAHMLISTIKGNISAWNIEKRRLKRAGHSLLSIHNTYLRGHMMSVLLVALVAYFAGLEATLYFSACAIAAKFLLELVNYMEHYGMVRNPEKPVQPRHSWNTNKRISSWSMFNLTRHSHHHAQGEVAYQDLKPFADAPMMIGGYLSTLVVAAIPPLWHAVMTPKVLDWDERYASQEEKLLAKEANAKSGIPKMMECS